MVYHQRDEKIICHQQLVHMCRGKQLEHYHFYEELKADGQNYCNASCE